MKILVVGSGGREHAIVWKLSQSKRVTKIFCAPGNAGTSTPDGRAVNVPLKVDDLQGLLEFAQKEKIDLTVIGPELPLTLGLANLFQKNNLRVFGPKQEGAILEGSKAWMKNFLKEEKIPTAIYETFDEYEAAVHFLNTQAYPIVIKADGLAAGKGVIIAKDRHEAVQTLGDIFQKKIFGSAGNRVVIEEFLEGEEASFLAFVDGKNILPLDSAQDHKRVFDQDQGPNTGGMGAYSPAPVVTAAVRQEVIQKILNPTLQGLLKRNIDFRGVLYAGLMLTKQGPKLLEYNVRFGDPETQPLLMRLENDLLDVFEAVVDQKLDQLELSWKKGFSLCVVMAACGYPGELRTGDVIEGLDRVSPSNDLMVFHAGTVKKDNHIVTSGGRVLGVTAWGENLTEAQGRAYQTCSKINFAGAHYRKDIGHRALK